ncbi:hypothetical protein QFZ37_003434 [Chryseobacterium ginsenosidimutans]|uniref:hypothetical protein n=1 Tax=Chryseobacterium ginsenosidimutans TaxID=687846 RepID=UPI0027853A4A|nr:hypothetical protein [Chryseobacterium ginsenosidimutans]MDQ0595065.1 hypothetical protein [Chryseobacterium ginsenosidimutans]
MKKSMILLGALMLSSLVYSQVGINNSDPKATLDVTAIKTDGTTAEGIIAPRLTGDQIQSGDAKYTANQKGAIVYATAAVTAPSAKTANITAAGYYYFDGSLWVKFDGNDWHLTGNAGTSPAGTVPITMASTDNYIGTSTGQNLVIGVNNTSRAIFNKNGSLIGGAGLANDFSPTIITPVQQSFPLDMAGSLVWGTGNKSTAGSANLAAVFGRGNTVNSSIGLTTGINNSIGLASVSSMVSGQNNTIDNFQSSIVSGDTNKATYTTSGRGNMLVGQGNILSGSGVGPIGAIVGGVSNKVNGVGLDGIAVFGTGNTVNTNMANAAVVGKYNTAVDNSLFIVGNGVSGTTKNAVVVLSSGNVGVGIDAPAASLDVKGTFKLVDGTQGSGKVLTSDASGNASWKNQTINTVLGVKEAGWNGRDIPTTQGFQNGKQGQFLHTGAYVDLPPGKWAINVTMLMRSVGATLPAATTSPDTSYWLRTTFTTSNADTVTITATPSYIQGSYLISGNLPGSSLYSLVQGTIVINNTGATTTRYYYVAGDNHIIGSVKDISLFGGYNWQEDQIVAYKID